MNLIKTINEIKFTNTTESHIINIKIMIVQNYFTFKLTILTFVN